MLLVAIPWFKIRRDAHPTQLISLHHTIYLFRFLVTFLSILDKIPRCNMTLRIDNKIGVYKLYMHARSVETRNRGRKKSLLNNLSLSIIFIIVICHSVQEIWNNKLLNLNTHSNKVIRSIQVNTKEWPIPYYNKPASARKK